jgi:DAK2 domain fusion protein YloV
MYLTMRAAWGEVAKGDDDDIGRVAQAVAQGALMGARGNSGVILSQILRGMAHVWRDQGRVEAEGLVLGLQRGSDTAYKGVVKPVEGTILTVIREAAEAARRAAVVEKDIFFILDHTVQAAAESVERTPLLLPVLARAGVVDSGGKGLYYVLEGMARGLRGEPLRAARSEGTGYDITTAIDPLRLPPIRYGFDVQFLVWGTGLDVEAIRRRMQEMGDHVLVEGSETLVKAHVHVFDPSVPLAYGYSLGFLTDVVVENMDAMATAGQVPHDVTDMLSMAQQPVQAAEGVDRIGVIAVVPGPGLQRVFESLGVAAVVPGGQTMNPSTQELWRAIEGLPVDEAILLPNNSNIILTAQQAQELSSKRVKVVPSRTVPQGVSALLALNRQAGLEENATLMTRALADIDTGEVTMAVRDASFDGVTVKAGEVIGLLNDTLSAKGRSPEEVVSILLAQMEADHREIITIYHGQEITAAVAQALGSEVAAAYPDQEVEVISGGQPHYFYIISAE